MPWVLCAFHSAFFLDTPAQYSFVFRKWSKSNEITMFVFFFVHFHIKLQINEISSQQLKLG